MAKKYIYMQESNVLSELSSDKKDRKLVELDRQSTRRKTERTVVVVCYDIYLYREYLERIKYERRIDKDATMNEQMNSRLSGKRGVNDISRVGRRVHSSSS